MKKIIPIITLWMSGATISLFAQTIDTIDIDSLLVDTLQLIQTTHYNYHYNNGQRQISYIQKTKYDTNGIIIHQKRDFYQKSDTGAVINRHYLLEYNPNTLHGFYQTEKLALGNQAYSIQKTTFKNYNRSSNKRYWVKTQKPNSNNLLRQVRYDYDNNGYMIKKEANNYETNPTSSSIEKVTRNAAGNMLTWVSYDDDGDTKTQARSFSASYLDDTLLLRSDDQLYYNHTTVINKYTRKRQLKKTHKRVGSHSTKGKIKYNNETIIIYKKGQSHKLIEKSFKKKVKTIIYAYLPNEEIQHVTTPKKSYTERQHTVYHDQFTDFPIKRTETKEGAPFLTETWIYEDNTGQLLSHIMTEKRSNGKDWKKEVLYNEQGDIITKRFFVGNVLKIEEVYDHLYQ